VSAEAGQKMGLAVVGFGFGVGVAIVPCPGFYPDRTVVVVVVFAGGHDSRIRA